MPRDLQRLCLQDGLRLDLNALIRRGQLLRNGLTRARVLRWTHSYWGEIANGLISADMRDEPFGWAEIRIGKHPPQSIRLRADRRHYGGWQWYFVCPTTGRQASTLWRPNGATKFASRQAWGNRVAYRSQFLDRTGRAHHAQAIIKNRLCEIGGFNPDEWDLPPRPKRMRATTYARWENRFDYHDDVLNDGLAGAVERLLAKGF